MSVLPSQLYFPLRAKTNTDMKQVCVYLGSKSASTTRLLPLQRWVPYLSSSLLYPQSLA